MPDAEDDLRSTSETIEDDAERLATMEGQKRRLQPDDPRVVDLSREIEALVNDMATKATAERELSEEIQRD
jgi:hypothetical protein